MNVHITTGNRQKEQTVARKTIQVEAVKKTVNDMLRNSIPELQEGRIGAYMVLERVLFDTGNYHGYRYISPNNDASNIAGQFDDTRRYYL